jgi:hypothetical protein
VLEGHVEEAALFRLKLFVELSVDCRLRNCQGEVIGRELFGVATEHVARELIE